MDSEQEARAGRLMDFLRIIYQENERIHFYAMISESMRERLKLCRDTVNLPIPREICGKDTYEIGTNGEFISPYKVLTIGSSKVNSSRFNSLFMKMEEFNSHEYGIFFTANPLVHKRRMKATVSNIRWLVIESDEDSIEDQNALLERIKPVVSVAVSSGGRSIHQYIRIDPAIPNTRCLNPADYRTISSIKSPHFSIAEHDDVVGILKGLLRSWDYHPCNSIASFHGLWRLPYFKHHSGGYSDVLFVNDDPSPFNRYLGIESLEYDNIDVSDYVPISKSSELPDPLDPSDPLDSLFMPDTSDKSGRSVKADRLDYSDISDSLDFSDFSDTLDFLDISGKSLSVDGVLKPQSYSFDTFDMDTTDECNNSNVLPVSGTTEKRSKQVTSMSGENGKNPCKKRGTVITKDLLHSFIDDLRTVEKLKKDGIPQRSTRIRLHKPLFTHFRIHGLDDARIENLCHQIYSIAPDNIGCGIDDAVESIMQSWSKVKAGYKLWLPLGESLPNYNICRKRKLRQALADMGCPQKTIAPTVSIVAKCLYPAMRKKIGYCVQGKAGLTARQMRDAAGKNKDYHAAMDWMANANILICTDTSYESCRKSRRYFVNAPLILYMMGMETADISWDSITRESLETTTGEDPAIPEHHDQACAA